MSVPHVLMVVSALVVLISALTGIATGQSADEHAVRRAVGAFDEALNSRDFGAFASSLAEDVDLVSLSGPVVSGPTAVRDALERSWDAQPAERTVTSTVSQIRFPSDDVAIVDAVNRFATEYGPGVAGPTFRMTGVLVHVSDQWKWVALRLYAPDTGGR